MPSEPEIISLLAHLPTTVSERDRLTTQVDSRANHFAAIVFSGLSVIAVLPVPYLTLRSISFLVTQQSDLTFNQMMHSDNSWFWFFGPLTAV